MVISSDASYCNFTCLSLEATRYLNVKGELPWKHIRERPVLHGSLQQLLYGSADKTDPVKEITEGNSLREKLEFITSVLDGWIQGGGMGCLLRPQDFAWRGQQLEDNKKLDWASVGRFGGDVS
jgi:myosin-1